MLKAKMSTSVSRNKQKAMKEVSKEECSGLYVCIPKRLVKKLSVYVRENDTTLVSWVSERIEEI